MQPVMAHSIPMLAPPVAPPPVPRASARGMHGCLQAPSPDSVPQAVFPSSMGELNPDAPSFVPQYYQGNAAQSAASQILHESDPPLRIEEFQDALLSQATKQGVGGDAAARTPPAHPPGLQARQLPPNLGLHPDRSMMADRSMMYPPNHYPRLPPQGPPPAQGPPPPAQPAQGPPPRAQPGQGPSLPVQPAQGSAAPTQPSSSSSGGGVRLFEDRWSEHTAVPENVKELWVPPQQPVVSHSHMYATVPPTSPPNLSSFAAPVARRHPNPSNVFPVELTPPGNPGTEAMKNIRTPSTAVPDSPPFLSSPTPYRAYQPNHANPPPANPPVNPPFTNLPAPAHEPSIDLGFATRTLLLKYRTSMGRFPAPWELKMKYKLVDGDEVMQEEDQDDASEANPTAGATLLKFVKGEASMSEVVGKAQGQELMQFLKGPEGPSNEKTKENEGFNVFNKLTAQTEQTEPEHHVWALNKILTTKLPAEENRWSQAQKTHADRQSWEDSADDSNWNWKSGRRRPMQQDSWHGWNSNDSWPERGDHNAWSWDSRERYSSWNGLPEGVHEAQRYKDGNMYVVVCGQWLRASAQYYCEKCQLFGNRIFEHLESNHHKRNVGRY